MWANGNIYSDTKFYWRMSCFALLVLLGEIIGFSQSMHYENTFFNLFCALQCIRTAVLKRFVLHRYYGILWSGNFWLDPFNNGV